MRELIARLADWFRRDRLDSELREELAFHREQLERDARAAGAGDIEARRDASRRLGNVTVARESARERWSWPLLEHWLQDTRLAVRGLRRSPGFSLTVIATLALGIGANLAMFNVIDQLMYRPLAMLRDPDRVHRLYLQEIRRGQTRVRPTFEYARYLDFRNGTSSFSQFAAFSERSLAVGTGDAARERRVGAVSAEYFEFFDAPPALGRYFTTAEDATPRGADVAVLSYALWKSEYGMRDVRGEVLQVGNVQARVIGVAPEGFAGVDESNPPQLFIPITTFAGSAGSDDAKTYFSRYSWGWLNVLMRRKPGVSDEAVAADLNRVFRRSWEAQRAMEPSLATVEVAKPVAIAGAVKPWAGPDPALEGRTSVWLTGIAAIVLAIACANVANLVLARALRRERETAVRLALGAARTRLLVQSVTETLLLSLVAGACGVLLAAWGGIAIRRILLNPATPSSDSLATMLEPRTLLLAGLLSLVVGLVTGLIPALLSGKADLAPSLRGGARGGHARRSGLRTSLLVVQGGLTVSLLVGAALFVRSLGAVRDMPMGYDAGGVLRVNRIERGGAPTAEQRTTLRKRLLAAAQALPEVEAASWTSSTPFISTSSTGLFVTGIDSVQSLGDFTYQATTPDYFRVMRTRIVRGRGLTDADRAGAPAVAVVGESMARRLWPDKDAIGQCMRVFADTMPCTTVVGIAEDMVQRDLLASERYHYYLSIDQFTRTHGNGLLLRLRGDPAVQGEAVRRALQREMPGMSYVTVQPLSEIVEGAQRSWRLGATLLVMFGLLALAVAAVGLYGTINYDVAQRMHELGVRVALGATGAGILRLVVGSSVRVAAVGVVIGAGVALAASRWVQPLLFRQSATDPVVYALVAALMLVVAVAASAAPAVTASRADPNAALREE